MSKQQKFFSFTHSVLTKHIIIIIVSLSHPEMEMGIILKIYFKTRDGNRKTVYARLFVPTVVIPRSKILGTENNKCQFNSTLTYLSKSR